MDRSTWRQSESPSVGEPRLGLWLEKNAGRCLEGVRVHRPTWRRVLQPVLFNRSGDASQCRRREMIEWTSGDERGAAGLRPALTVTTVAALPAACDCGLLFLHRGRAGEATCHAHP